MYLLVAKLKERIYGVRRETSSDTEGAVALN
jgi:hypothetical protein